MNIKLITMFNVMPKATENNYEKFETVNAESTKYGWIIHPDCCSTIALDWIRKEAAINYNRTFYKEWTDVISKTRFELLVDQILHYASTYGTNYTMDGNGYVPNDVTNVEIPFEKFKVIMPATEEEIYTRCVKMLQSGIALETETINILVEYITTNKLYEKYNLDINTIKNKEAAILLSDITGILPSDPFAMLRYFVYKATGKSMLIKDKATITAIKENANKVDFTKLTHEQKVALSSIFYRFKPIFLAFKKVTPSAKKLFENDAFKRALTKAKIKLINGVKTNASVINELRRLAVVNHKPFKAGFWETILTEEKDLNELAAKLASGEVSNYKKVTVMQGALAKLQNAKGKIFVLRNGKMWVRQDYPANSTGMTSYLMKVYTMLEDSLAESIKNKACTVRFPKNINLTIPTSEKNFIGNYPFGTSVDMGDSHNIIGIYWRNEWGTHDFDLHYADMNGINYGWNASYTDKSNKIIYSGDMTSANPEATELFYVSKDAPDGKVSVCQFNGEAKSQFKLFVAREDLSTKQNISNYMCNPNNVVAEFMIPVDNERDKQCALVADNKIYLMDLTQGSSRVPNTKYSEVYIEQLKNKCRSFVSLKPILEKAGFTFVEDDDTEVELDLTNLSKDSLINLFAEQETPNN